MTEKQLFSKIKKLKNLRPSQDWLVSGRQDLINHIADEEKEFKTLDRFFDWFWYHRLQPSMLAVCMLLIIGAGPLLTVKAAQSSLPGDLLYAVKKAAEKVQVSIASDDAKAQIQVDFASRRIEELERITEDSFSSEEKTARSKEVIADLKSSIAEATEAVESMPKEQIAVIAKKTKKIEDDLTKVKEDIQEDVQEVMAEAEQIVGDVNERILAILVEAEEIASSTEDIMEDIKEDVEDGIEAIDFIIDQEAAAEENMGFETTTEDILE